VPRLHRADHLPKGARLDAWPFGPITFAA
jgi:hypothetical protein